MPIKAGIFSLKNNISKVIVANINVIVFPKVHWIFEPFKSVDLKDFCLPRILPTFSAGLM